jgi:putative endonuclease
VTEPNDWFVYILKCADGSLYTGITRDLDARIKTHNDGTGAKYTRGRLPVKLVYSEAAENRSSASQREHEIKQLPRQSKLALFNSCQPHTQQSCQ